MSSIEKKQVLIDPNYLIQISNIVELLNHFYEQDGIGSISNQYRNMLVSSFTNLNHNLQIYSSSIDSSAMVNSSIVKCKAQIQLYCLQKLGFMVHRDSSEIGTIIFKIASMYQQNIQDMEKIILTERRKRIQSIENEKDTIIEKLRQELIYRKQYIAELKQRIEQVEQQNSSIYQKMIGNAKNSTERALSNSPKKNISVNSNLNSSLAKLKSEALLGTAHKTLSAKQVEETIIDIMETKQRQETVKGKKVSLKNFLKTYFRYKFGMKDLADQTQMNFKQAVYFFSQSQEKNIFILFQKMCSQECEQQYYEQQKLFYEKLIKVIKRYLNQKQGIHLDELERIYQNKIMDQRSDIKLTQKDVQYILINTYKTSQVDSLQMILNEIIIQKLPKATNQIYTEQLLLPSKKLINEILNYELNRHLIKIEDIIRVIRDVDNNGRGYLNQEDLENTLVRLKIPEQKIEPYMDLINMFEGKFITYSETIETVQKIRRTKVKKLNERIK